MTDKTLQQREADVLAWEAHRNKYRTNISHYEFREIWKAARAQPRYILRMNGSEVQKELDALTAQPARQKVGAGDGDTYIGRATVYRKPQPAPAAGDAFSDVLLEQHQGDCIQRINIPNARLVAALPAPSVGENTVVEIKPCPYVNGFSADNKEVSFVLQKYDGYADFVLFDDGKPSRCFRIAAGVIRGGVVHDHD